MKFRISYATILFFTVLVAIDQLSKFIIRHSGGFYICNKNLAFGIGFGNWMIAFIVLFVLILFLNFKYQKTNHKQIPNHKKLFLSFPKFEICDLFVFCNLGFVILISGGFSNILDRIKFGCIIDFINLRPWPVFNLADIFICLGAIILLAKLSKK